MQAIGVPVQCSLRPLERRDEDAGMTPLEPGAIDFKWYGADRHREGAGQDGSERAVLVSFRRA